MRKQYCKLLSPRKFVLAEKIFFYSILSYHDDRFFWILVKFKDKFQKSSSIEQNAEAVARSCSVKKMFLKILPNSKENTYGGVSF